MQRSIRTRLLLTFIVLAIVPLLIVGVVSGGQGFSTSQQRALDLQRQTAARVAIEVRAFLQQYETELNTLIQIRGLRGMSRDQLKGVLDELMTHQNVYNELAILDEQGQESLRVSRKDVVADVDLVLRSQAEEFITPRKTGEVYYSRVWVDPETGEPLMRMALPVTNPQSGTIESVLVADIRFKQVWDLILKITTEQKTTIYLVDSRGKVVAHRDPSLVLKGTRFTVPAEDGVYDGLDGTAAVLASKTMQFGQETLITVAEKPASEATATAVDTAAVTVVLVLVILALAIMLGVAMVRRIVHPIQSLATTAQAIMAGDLSRQAEITTRDEIGSLASAFNSMTAQLRQTLEGLQQNVKDLEKTRSELVVANEALRESEASLERRVTDRTRDLQIAADVSRQVTTILDLNELLQVVVEQTKEAFNLYHTSIFLHNGEQLVLQAGTGKAGEMMKAEGWHFDLAGHGLVPEASRQHTAVVINDTLAEARHRANPYLPDTHSEVALPMFVGEKLIGVLDLQSEQLNRFSADDIRVMTTLAEQIAIAVNNADLYAEQLQVAEKLRSVDTMKSQFLASMSHELRTPLNAILNFTEFVAMGMLGPVNEGQIDALNKAIESGNHLLALINDVLDMTKIESGSMKLFIEQNIDLHIEVEPVAAMTTSLLNGKTVAFIKEIDQDLPLVSGDRRRIRQILLNLLSNAAKFTEEGSITLRVKRQDHEVLFSVIDTGPGIALEDQDRIFEPFVQTDKGIAHAGGTGLGLPISRRLAEAHGGHLWVESQLGAGTTFYATIPIIPQSSSSATQNIHEDVYAK